MRYTNDMAADDMTFSLDIDAAQVILTDMAAPLVKQSADAIASRASSMVASMTKDPVNFTVTTQIGTIRRGVRAIATVTADGINEHANYMGRMALTKSKDAGRV